MVASKFRIAAAIALAFSFCASVQASETDAFCALAAAKAQTQAQLLTAPEAFASVGDPVTGARAATIGVRKYISRGQQGELALKLAQAECDAYRAQNALAEQLTGVEARAQLARIIAKKPGLERALAMAQESLEAEEGQLQAQTATIADVNAAYERRDRLRQELAGLARERSLIQNQLAQAGEPLAELVDRAISAQADVADIEAKLAAMSGWEVAVSGGVRAEFNGGGKQEGFVAVTASRSFGYSGAQDAASRVGALTDSFLRSQRDGALQQLLRARDSVAGVVAAERIAGDSLSERQQTLRTTLARLEGVSTAEGQRTLRALQVELVHVDALLQASQAYTQSLSRWLDLNAGV